MRISGWRIDGYGLLADFDSGEIGPGLTVVHGPNEAGKSTLVAFIRGVLFGYPNRRRQEPTHEPIRGGRHGGLVRLVSESGEQWTVERHVGQRAPVVTDPGGQDRTECDLRRLLGGASAALFKSVFAFSLGELQDLGALDDAAIRDLLFSAGIMGAGQTATQALRQLDERCNQLARPRKHDARANALLAELELVEGQLRRLRERTQHFPDEQRAVEALAAEVESRRQESDAIRRRSAELELLVTLRPLAERAAACRAELHTLGYDEAPEASSLEFELVSCPSDLGPTLAALQADASGYGARRERLEELELRRISLEASIDGGLRVLGPKWDRARIERTDASVPVVDEARHFERRLAEAARIVHERSIELESAEEVEWEAIADAAAVSPGEDRSAAEIDADRAALRAVRTMATDLDRLLAREADLARQMQMITLSRDGARSTGAGGSRTALGRSRPIALPIGFFALAGMACWAILRGDPSVAIACIVLLAVVTAAWALGPTVLRHPGATIHAGFAPGPEDIAHDAQVAALVTERERLAAELAEAAASIGLSPRPAPADLERIEVTLERQERARSIAEDRRGRIRTAQIARSNAARRLDAAKEELAGANGEWGAWVTAHGLDGPLTPAAAVAILDAVRQADLQISELSTVCNDMVKVSPLLDEFEEQARRLLEQAGMPAGEHVAGSGLRERLQALADRVATESDHLRLVADLRRRLSDCEQQITARLGDGQRGQELRRLLDQSTMADLEEAQREAALRAQEVESTLEEAVRHHQDAARELDETSASAEIALLDQTRERLCTALTEAMSEWWSLTIAKSLVSATLERYERERQPLVVQRASELFSTVTAGAYTRIVTNGGAAQRAASRERAIEVIDDAGRRFEATALSAGTIEQLYLCLRLALAETFADQSVSLPFVMDDVLVNFDPQRARAIATAIASAAERHQVFLLTCHPHIVKLMRDVSPHAGEIILPRYGAA